MRATAPAAKSADQMAAGRMAALETADRRDAAGPPVADLPRLLRGPWQRREAREMPRLQTILRDAQGAAIGALAFDDQGVWWRPWLNGQPVPWAQRAPLDAGDVAALRQRYPTEMKPPE